MFSKLMLSSKKVISLIPVLLIIVFVSISYLKVKRNNEKERAIQELQNFKLKSVYGSYIFDNTYLNGNKKSVFLYFDSTCELCRHELKQLEEILEKLHNTNIILMSAEENEIIANFLKAFSFEEYSNIFIGSSEYPNLEHWFGNLKTPTCLIYSKNKKLIKKTLGPISMQKLLEILA